MTKTEGRKFDNEKPRYDLIPPEALYALAELYTIGAKKYGDRNWEKGMRWGRVFSALMRHAWAWLRGEKYDPADGQHHLIAVAWNAFTLYIYETRNRGVDDRFVREGEETGSPKEPRSQGSGQSEVSTAGAP